jgi:hypothetical protein
MLTNGILINPAGNIGIVPASPESKRTVDAGEGIGIITRNLTTNTWVGGAIKCPKGDVHEL